MDTKKRQRAVTILGILILFAVVLSCFKTYKMNVQAGSGEPIIAVTREEGSGTRSAFGEMIGLSKTDLFGERGDATSAKIPIAGSTEEMLRQIELTKNGIGYVSMGAAKLEESQVKILSVEGVEPTEEQIANGDYILSRPLQLIYMGELTENEADFLRYVKSEGQGVIAETNYVPIRKKGVYLKGKPEGTIKISGSSSMAPLMKKLAKAYMKENPDLSVEISTSDSAKGMKDVVGGKSNFGMVSRELYSYEKDVLETETIAKDGVAVIVNEANVLEDISVSQMKKIYTKSIESWDYLQVYE